MHRASRIIETRWRLLHLLHHVAKTRGTLLNSANRCYYDWFMKQDYTEAQFLWAHTLFNQLISRFQVQILGSIEKQPHRLFRKPSSTAVQHVSHANKNPERLRTTNKVFLDVYVGSEKLRASNNAGDAWTWKRRWVILTSEAFKILVLKFSTISNMFMQMETQS